MKLQNQVIPDGRRLFPSKRALKEWADGINETVTRMLDERRLQPVKSADEFWQGRADDRSDGRSWQWSQRGFKRVRKAS